MSEVLVTQSYPTLCDPVDCSPPVSSVHGIFQARILEPSSRGSSQPRDQTHLSCNSCIGRWILYHCLYLQSPVPLWIGFKIEQPLPTGNCKMAVNNYIVITTWQPNPRSGSQWPKIWQSAAQSESCAHHRPSHCNCKNRVLWLMSSGWGTNS